jgi:Protein of unknown function (DUF2786)
VPILRPSDLFMVVQTVEYGGRMKEKVVQKIKKLLSLGNSSNENEAALALERARQLLLKHKLEIQDLKLDAPELEEDITEHQRDNKANVEEMKNWAASLLSQVMKSSFCRVYFTSLPGNPYAKIHLVGKPSDLEIAKEMFHFIYRQVYNLSRTFSNTSIDESILSDANNAFVAAPIRGTRTTEKMRADFRAGCGRRVRERLWEITRQQNHANTQTTALVVQEDKKLSEYMSSLRLGSIRGGSTARQASTAYQRGTIAGNTVRLRREIGRNT